jgi:hypothetical protein
MANDEKKDAPPSSHSSFQRFERVMKALIAVPKKEVDAKIADVRRKRVKQKSSQSR